MGKSEVPVAQPRAVVDLIHPVLTVLFKSLRFMCAGSYTCANSSPSYISDLPTNISTNHMLVDPSTYNIYIYIYICMYMHTGIIYIHIYIYPTSRYWLLLSHIYPYIYIYPYSFIQVFTLKIFPFLQKSQGSTASWPGASSRVKRWRLECTASGHCDTRGQATNVHPDTWPFIRPGAGRWVVVLMHRKPIGKP